MKQLLTTLFFIFLSSCIGKTPGSKKFVGIWKSASGAQLELKTDGTFTGKSLPTKLFFSYVDSTVPTYFDGDGHWDIKTWKIQFPSIIVDFDNTSIIKTSSTQIFVSGSGFTEEQPPWNTLFIWVGEEGGNRYEFKRQLSK
jgi:hypothetical protein